MLRLLLDFALFRPSSVGCPTPAESQATLLSPCPSCRRAVTWRLIVLGLLGTMSGCQPPTHGLPSEASLAQQIAAVELGTSNRIDLIETYVDDDALTALPPLPQLRSLRIERCQLSDISFPRIAEQSNLEVLVLGNTTCTSEGLASLANSTALRTLNLDRSQITDPGLVHLGNLPALEMLRLGSSRITGSGLEHLGGLGSLRHLILQRAPLTDEGLDHLRQHKQLESLYLEDTQVTDEGLDRSYRHYPNCTCIGNPISVSNSHRSSICQVAAGSLPSYSMHAQSILSVPSRGLNWYLAMLPQFVGLVRRK